MRWAALALGIAVYDWALDRAGLPMLSHDYWCALGDPDVRWLPVGATAAVAYHLNRPRRTWAEAIVVGMSAAAVTRIMR